MPATISSCLNSCGLCGSAYQLPGCSRAGTRKSRAPSGVLRVSVGVSTSTKSCAVEHVAGGPVDLGAQAQRLRWGRCAAGRGSGTAAGPPRPRRRGSSIGNGSGAAALSTSTSSAIDLDLAGRQVRGSRCPRGAARHLAGRPRRSTRCAGWCATDSSRTTTCDDAAGVAQVEEGDAAVVAAARHPAGERDGLPASAAAACRRRGCGSRELLLQGVTTRGDQVVERDGVLLAGLQVLELGDAGRRGRARRARRRTARRERSAAFIAPFRPRPPYDEVGARRRAGAAR